MRSKYLLPLSLLLLAACGDDPEDAYIDPTEEPAETIDVEFTPQMADSIWNLYLPAANFVDAPETIPTDSLDPDYEEFVETWLGTETTRDVVIMFNGSDATVTFKDTSKKTKEAVKVTKEGAHVVIRNEKLTDGVADGRARMNYILRGKTEDGSVRIYSNKKFMVTLDSVSITNPSGSAINAQKSFEKKRMFLNLQKGTQNYLCDAEVYTDTVPGEDEKGTLFSEGKLILCGEGELHVAGRRTHAIASDDRIRIHSGITLAVDSAHKDGIHTKDALVMTGGKVSVYARKDAIQTADSLENKGLTLQGGLLQLCAKRAITSYPVLFRGTRFCAITKEEFLPTAGDDYTVKEEPGYLIYYSEN